MTVTGSEIKAISLGAEIEALEAYTFSGVKAGGAVSTHKVLVRP